MKPILAVLFDLDGTLANTIGDLHCAVNHALAQAHLPQRTKAETLAAVGNGIRRLIDLSLPAGTPAETADSVFEAFRSYYASHLLVHTEPYPGIPALLTRLKAAGIRIGVVSNKFDAGTQAICKGLFPDLTDVVSGEIAGCPRKPAPDLPLRLLSSLRVLPEDALFVGDSEVDAATARSAGMRFLAVTWGFRTHAQLAAAGARCFADSPNDIARVVFW